VIPGKLRVKIFLHDVTYENAIVPCWTYLTDGLLMRNQKEIMVTLRRDVGQTHEDYPRELLRVFSDFFQLAEQGQLVDVGDSTLFNEEGLYGRKDVRGIGYVEAESFPGVETPDSPVLAGILLKNDEALIAWRLGLTRVVALLGKHHRYYPCPTWSDLNRQPVTSLTAMETSILQRVVRVRARASFYHEPNHLFLRIFPGSREYLRKIVPVIPPPTALALRTQVDPRANACLVWPVPDITESVAITPTNSDGSRKTGAFVLFVSEQSSNSIRTVEDGVAVLLTDSDWKKVRDALHSGSDILIPLTEQGGGTFSLEWWTPEAYTSPVTGETVLAESWTTHKPQGLLVPPKLFASISASRLVLLTSDRHLRERTTAEDLGAYAKEIENAVDKFFVFPERRTRRALTIHLALTRGGSMVQFVATPELNSEDTEELLTRLNGVRAPRVAGPVNLESIMALWDFAAH